MTLIAGDVDAYNAGVALRRHVPRRVAKKWATRLLSDVQRKRLHDDAHVRAEQYIAARDSIEAGGGTEWSRIMVKHANSYRALRRAFAPAKFTPEAAPSPSPAP